MLQGQFLACLNAVFCSTSHIGLILVSQFFIFLIVVFKMALNTVGVSANGYTKA